jgi:hypothetical protein
VSPGKGGKPGKARRRAAAGALSVPFAFSASCAGRVEKKFGGGVEMTI